MNTVTFEGLGPHCPTQLGNTQFDYEGRQMEAADIRMGRRPTAIRLIGLIGPDQDIVLAVNHPAAERQKARDDIRVPIRNVVRLTPRQVEQSNKLCETCPLRNEIITASDEVECLVLDDGESLALASIN